MTRAAWARLLLAVAVIAMAPARAQPAAQAPEGKPAEEVAPIGTPRPAGLLRDSEFGVVTRQFALERSVEMYQWHRAGQGYFAGWSLEPVDSAGFAPGHDNPGEFPLQGREWRDLRVTLDGKPLAADAVARLGAWRSFRPNFSALPGNLSATFQPEGDGLGSAENPLDPQVGDLRVTWRELVLPPLAGKVLLRDGEWKLAGAQASEDRQPGTVLLEDPDEPDTGGDRTLWFGVLGLLAVLAAVIALLRRRRRKA